MTGTKYTAVKGGSDTYDFVPSKSGDYSVSFNGKGGVLVYDDAWNEIKNIILKKQTEAVLFFRWNRKNVSLCCCSIRERYAMGNRIS